jgi:hypothetical protein
MPSSRKQTVKHLLSLFALLAFLFSSPYARPQQPVSHEAHRFQTEAEAQKYCPNDTVVWVNTKSGVYHFKGQRWYGRTKDGAYECRKEADAEGDRPTHNGQ